MATSWFRLPGEIQLMVWEAIIAQSKTYPKPTLPSSAQATGNHSIGRLASVCQDWQEFFERHTFQRLALAQDHLPMLQEVVERRAVRLTYIRNISLRLRLPEYRSTDSHRPEEQTTINENNEIFSSSVRLLLKVLSSWKLPKGRQVDVCRGLALEISAFSPSDNKYGFFFCEQEEQYPFRFEEDLDQTPSLPEYNRQRAALEFRPFSWHTRRVLPREAQRLYGNPLQLRATVPVLPKCPIVTGLLIRRQTFRSVDVGSLAQIVRQSLVRLAWFRYERRIAATRTEERVFIQGYLARLIPALPSSMRQLNLTQWAQFSDHYHSEAHLGKYPLGIGRALANSRARRHLTEFTACAQVDVMELLWPYSRGEIPKAGSASRLKWDRLELLALNPRCFRSTHLSQRRLDRLICVAAASARNMPKLRVMELWGSSSDGAAYIFKYKVEEDGPRITMTSGDLRPFELGNRSKMFWAEVVIRLGWHYRPLVVKEERLRESAEEVAASHGRCIFKHLELKRQIFDPITLAQLEEENAVRIIWTGIVNAHQ